MNITEIKSKCKHAGWLNERQMQEFTGFSHTKLWKLRVTGVLPFAKLGSTVLYSLDGLQDALEKNKITCIKK